jgi:hypothetical protein
MVTLTAPWKFRTYKLSGPAETFSFDYSDPEGMTPAIGRDALREDQAFRFTVSYDFADQKETITIVREVVEKE